MLTCAPCVVSFEHHHISLSFSLSKQIVKEREGVMAADGFEGFHVPQQSRRDKLRVTDSLIHPLYDPSDFVKEEASGLLAFAPSHYLDPQSSLPVLNPHDMATNNPFLYHSSSSYQLSNDTVSAPPTGHGLSLSLSSHHNGGGSTSNEVCVPLGPFTGYASILRGSRFLKPAQHLLEEFCDVGRGIYAADPSFMDHPPLDTLATAENRRNKSRLISLLDEVYRRYKQYYQQMQAVVASFEYVAGLGNAAPYANFALKTMSKHFKCLKNAITDQLQFSSKSHGQISHEAARYENVDRGFNSHRPVNNSGYLENQSVWRPQRGLPERAVTVLRAWLFEHFLHPYPTDTDKLMLAKQTGLSRSQVSNWFINARVRLWKPMVEEIHMLETRQSRQREEQNGNLNSANSMTSQRIEDSPSKRSRNEDPDARNEEQVGLTYNNVSRQQQAGVGGRGSVSLTLGLHQNNGIGLSEAFPMNAAQRFGLAMEGNSRGEGYVMGGFEDQHGLVGGQLLHDFVG